MVRNEYSSDPVVDENPFHVLPAIGLVVMAVIVHCILELFDLVVSEATDRSYYGFEYTTQRGLFIGDKMMRQPQFFSSGTPARK